MVRTTVRQCSQKTLVICLKMKLRRANTVTREVGCRYQQVLYLPPLSILSTRQKQQNSHLSYDQGGPQDKREQKDWVNNIRKITPSYLGACVCVYMQVYYCICTYILYMYYICIYNTIFVYILTTSICIHNIYLQLAK